MEKLVGDASVIVKWFIEEEYTNEALRLRDMHVNGEIMLAAPELLPFEVLNALKYSGLFEKEELKSAAISLSNYRIELHTLKGVLAEKTVEIAIDENITIYDASYVALATILKTKMFTADEKLVEKLAQKYGIYHISQAL